MSLIIAYPSDPFNPKDVDSDFLDEAKCFAAKGFPIVRLSEELTPLNPQILKTFTSPILYRGWMLSPQQYATMAQHLASRLLICPQTYLSSHHIVNWVQPLAAAQLTAATTILPFQELPDILPAFSSLPPQSWFVKELDFLYLFMAGLVVHDLPRGDSTLPLQAPVKGPHPCGKCEWFLLEAVV